MSGTEKTRKPKAKPKTGKKTKFQRFNTETIRRDKLKDAPYNPRWIGPEARKRLEKGMEEHGMVTAVVWNKRTGHVVGGHQRLSILDSLEKSQDYELDVAVIDVDEAEEKKINVQLNNPSMQGTWDLDALGDLHAEGIGFDDMGFSESDVNFLFEGASEFSAMHDTHEAAEAKDTLAGIKENRKQAQQRLADEQAAGFFVVLVCDSQKTKEDLMRRLGVPPHEQYIKSDVVARFLPDSAE
jgi:hypothetical protein